jgi:1,4-alpha-glucan branching enzyme
MPNGLLALVLHAHLPYVRHTDRWELVAERWLHEAVLETYLPLVDMLLRLAADGVKARLALSISPTLVAMLRDPLLATRYEEYAAAVGGLAAREAMKAQSRNDAATGEALRLYLRKLDRARQVRDAIEGDIVGALAALEDAGVVELMTTAATHAYLPLLVPMPRAVEAQVRLAIEGHRAAFGRDPAGFWLPECGWAPELEPALARHDVRYVVLESHGIERAEPAPALGVHAPLLTPLGIAAFGRDPLCSKQVWSATEGYPGDPWYREFYRDLGWEIPDDELGRLRPPPGGGRLPTGLKLCRVTGPTEDKAAYVPAVAARRAREHALDFVRRRRDQVTGLGLAQDRPPLIVAPFDAELFGHWWLEGPLFLEEVIRRVARGHDGLELVTPADVLSRWPRVQTALPAASSWGLGGTSEVWLSEENAWIHRHLHQTGRRLMRACESRSGALGVTRRALTQAVREHLLAQASDWFFLIRAGSAREYATRRVEDHLTRVLGLLDQLERGEVDELALGRLESASPIFPWLEPSIYGSDAES